MQTERTRTAEKLACLAINGLGARVVCKHHEGIFDFTLAAVRQHKAAFAATGIDCSDHAAKGWMSSLSYGVH